MYSRNSFSPSVSLTSLAIGKQRQETEVRQTLMSSVYPRVNVCPLLLQLHPRLPVQLQASARRSGHYICGTHIRDSRLVKNTSGEQDSYDPEAGRWLEHHRTVVKDAQL